MLGEYLVLAGQPAWVAAVGGRFRATPDPSAPAIEFPAGSPAGRLLAHARAAGWAGEVRARLSDDWRGEGGFGGSTAEYALVYRMLAPALGWSLDWAAAWRLYRELHAAEDVPPSGADLAAQWRGGVIEFDPIVPAAAPVDLTRFHWLAFSAAGLPGRKVATHEHLRRLREREVLDPRSELTGELSMVFAEARDARAGGDARALGACLTRYAETLGGAGLEANSAGEDRRVLARLPGVLGVKGAGAMLADAALVLLDGPAAAPAVRTAAEARGLRLVSQGLPGVAGLSEEEGL